MHSAEPVDPTSPHDAQPLIRFTLPREEMPRRFGPAHRRTDGQQPQELWAFRFPCGLAVFLNYPCATAGGTEGVVRADSPEIAHILHHLGLSDCLSWRLDHDDRPAFQARYGSPDCVRLIRQDDHGTMVEICAHPNERGAVCIQRYYEAAGHKQWYWIEKREIAGGATGK